MIATIIGTRPEIIKMSRLIPLLDKNFDHTFIFTCQHYSENMTDIFFSELKVRKPDKLLNAKTSNYSILINLCKKTLEKINPDYVLVYGDTNSTLAACVAAKILNKKVIHVEAGLRSFDPEMFEEVNRIVADHLSQLLFTPTNYTKKLLENENIKENVFVVGNTVVDAVLFYKKYLNNSKILKKLNIEPENYALLTLHRAETVDRPERFKSIIATIEKIDNKIVFPIHPRTKMRIEEFNIKLPTNIIPTSPLGYFDFLNLLKNSSYVLTDSGGVQEEAVTLKVPCITLRRFTERQETIEIGANFLTGYEEEKILNCVREIKETNLKKKLKKIKNPYGNGKASLKIFKILSSIL